MTRDSFRLFDTVLVENPLGTAASQRFRLNQRVLTNTGEESVVFVPLVLALASHLSPAHPKLLPFAVVARSAGQVQFWGGCQVASH
jgi:hypothetical protein